MYHKRVLDRNREFNWTSLVDRIVYTNDQQASVALQQKLKVATSDQKAAIIGAIILQAFPLMSISDTTDFTSTNTTQ